MKEEIESIKTLIKNVSHAALGTLEGEKPFVSATGFIPDDGESLSLVLLLSDLSRHTRNIKNDPAASLLIVEDKHSVSIHERMRVTFLGVVRRVTSPEKLGKLKEAYLERFPRSEVFFSLPDFHFYEFVPKEIHWIGGFGKAKTFDLEPPLPQ